MSMVNRILEAKLEAVRSTYYNKLAQAGLAVPSEFSYLINTELQQADETSETDAETLAEAEEKRLAVLSETIAQELSTQDMLALSGANSAQLAVYTEYDDLVLNASSAWGLPVDLIKAVMMTESTFRSDAVSGAGAQGLMQLMPRTAEGLGVTDSFDPEQNINAGTQYLRQQYDRFGDIRLALAAYNWGPGNVSGLGLSDGADPEQFARLPQSVQNYVNRVMSYADMV